MRKKKQETKGRPQQRNKELKIPIKLKIGEIKKESKRQTRKREEKQRKRTGGWQAKRERKSEEIEKRK